MAVIDCKRIGGRTGSHNSQFQKTYEVAYRLLTNDPLDGPYVVLTHDELPELYDPYEFGNDSDPSAFLVTKTPREESSDGSFRTWIVTCEYSSVPPVERNSNPLSEPPKVSTSFDQFTQIARFDVNQEPIKNSAGQAFTPPPEIDQSRCVVIIRRNELFPNLPLAMDMQDSVNAGAWRGCAPRTVKLRSISYSEIQERNGVQFHEATYEFHLFDQTWDLFILNQSTKVKNPLTGNLEQLPPGFEPQTIYTGAEGTTKNAIVIPGTSVTRDQVYVRYRVYKERNFGILNLN